MQGAPLEGLWTLLAVMGAAALIYRSLGGLFRLALRASQETAATGLAEVSARRGDVTAMVERQRAAAQARRDRRVQSFLTLGYILWLVLPLLLGGTSIAFPLAAVLWLMPTGRGATGVR